jgi:hypothetical protein
MTRRHLSKSLKEVHGGLRDWVSQRPEWLQPPLFGALFIYAFVLWRGGIIILPLAFLGWVFGPASDRAFLGSLLLAALVYAPAAGFLGGLLFAGVRPLLKRLGAFGRYLEFIFGAWVYCVVLVFVIVPILKPADKVALASPAGWVISGIMAIVYGLAIGVTANDDKAKAQSSDANESAAPGT